MGLSIALDVAIGLSFFYLLLSLIGTSANEAVASITRLRARTLRVAIDQIVDDERVRKAFWRSGLIRSLSRPKSKNQTDDEVAVAAGPSYLKSAAFADALVAAVRHAKAEQTEAKPPDAKEPTLTELVEKVDQNSILASVLTEFSGRANAQTDRVKQEIADWYDQVMERTSGAYRRHIQAISFVVALIIAVLLNADSVKLAHSLWFDNTLRGQIVETASDFVTNEGDFDTMMEFGEIQEALRPIPIGWDFATPPQANDWFRSVSGILAKIIGLVITAFAMTLGAPFWFDLLSRFVKIRSAGKEQTTGSVQKTSDKANANTGAA